MIDLVVVACCIRLLLVLLTCVQSDRQSICCACTKSKMVMDMDYYKDDISNTSIMVMSEW